MNNGFGRFSDQNGNNAEPGMGDINVMVKPSSLKNKTPMCLVNELARYNRIQHQYFTKREEGPPHRRKFTVVLKLCEEEYEAQSSSIKKAQHEAAAIALRNTKYRHPPVKLLSNIKKDITPTVQLNALSMKRALPLSYTLLNQPSPNYFQPTFPVNYCNRNIYQSRTVYNEFNTYNEINVMNRYSSYHGSSYNGSQFNSLRFKCPQSLPLIPTPAARSVPYKISLKVGNREFVAEANDVQTARHRAAKVAVNELLANSTNDSKSEDGEISEEDSKSPISAVYEKAFRHNLHVVFEVIDEHGPPHMRTFVTECRVDQFKTTGEGNSKKVSKRRAAAKMIVSMETLPPTPKASPEIEEKRLLRKKVQSIRKRSSRLNKLLSNGSESESKTEVNPITRLMEYQRKKHAKEPVYVIVDEKGKGRKKQFTMEIRIDEFKCTAVGVSKKEAKHKASVEMLKVLGLEPDSSKDSPSLIESKSIENDTSVDSICNGKQLAPGLLLVPNVNRVLQDDKKSKISPKDIKKSSNENINEVIDSEVNGNDTDKHENLYNGINNNGILSNGIAHFDDLDHTTQMEKKEEQYFSLKHKIFSNVNIEKQMARDQLTRIADIFGYEARFSDFPKGHHHREFLSLVTLNTNPPQTCYGSGNSTESAQNEAAFNALSMISEMGVDTLFTKKISAYIPEKEIAS